jgi:hypothetical protein
MLTSALFGVLAGYLLFIISISIKTALRVNDLPSPRAVP